MLCEGGYTTTTVPSHTRGGSSGSAQQAAQVVTTAEQRIATAFATAFNRLGRGPPPPHGGGGGGGPPHGGQPGGNPPGGQPAPQQPIAQAADLRAMGTPPQPFTGNRDEAEDFIDSLLSYFQVNRGVPGFESPIRRVAMALTHIQGPDTAIWKRKSGAWLNLLHPVNDNIEDVFTQWLAEFRNQYMNSQGQQQARQKLANHKMTFPNIDPYANKFEDLC